MKIDIKIMMRTKPNKFKYLSLYTIQYVQYFSQIVCMICFFVFRISITHFFPTLELLQHVNFPFAGSMKIILS